MSESAVRLTLNNRLKLGASLLGLAVAASVSAPAFAQGATADG